MKVKISEDSKKAVALRLPRGEQTFPVCAEQLFQILGKTKTIFRKGPAIYEIIDYPIEMQVLTPINLVARADKYCFTYILASAPKAKQSAASKTKKLIPKRCRMFIEEAKILLGTAEARRYLPNIRVATNAPVLYLHKDKLQIATTGYNPLCEVYVLEGVKDLPVMGSVQKAQATLLDLISEFNFATAGDQARAYAAMIAPALNFGGILTSPFPMDYSEADKSQSGKSLRHRMIHTIYHETPFVIPQKTKGLGSYEENLSNGLLSGKAFIIHDNFTGDLRLPVLESAIKGQGIIGARVFGKEEMQVPTYDVIYQMSSNDASIGMDLANRSMIVRLVKHPPTHKFKRSEHELIAQIEKEREVILASIFTLIKDRWKRGSPRGDLIEHTFPEY
jgi:hypothetical protein